MERFQIKWNENGTPKAQIPNGTKQRINILIIIILNPINGIKTGTKWNEWNILFPDFNNSTQNNI
jgi:hypothetical protein